MDIDLVAAVFISTGVGIAAGFHTGRRFERKIAVSVVLKLHRQATIAMQAMANTTFTMIKKYKPDANLEDIMKEFAADAKSRGFSGEVMSMEEAKAKRLLDEVNHGE